MKRHGLNLFILAAWQRVLLACAVLGVLWLLVFWALGSESVDAVPAVAHQNQMGNPKGYITRYLDRCYSVLVWNNQTEPFVPCPMHRVTQRQAPHLPVLTPESNV